MEWMSLRYSWFIRCKCEIIVFSSLVLFVVVVVPLPHSFLVCVLYHDETVDRAGKRAWFIANDNIFIHKRTTTTENMTSKFVFHSCKTIYSLEGRSSFRCEFRDKFLKSRISPNKAFMVGAFNNTAYIIHIPSMVVGASGLRKLSFHFGHGVNGSIPFDPHHSQISTFRFWLLPFAKLSVYFWFTLHFKQESI